MVWQERNHYKAETKADKDNDHCCTAYCSFAIAVFGPALWATVFTGVFDADTMFLVNIPAVMLFSDKVAKQSFILSTKGKISRLLRRSFKKHRINIDS